MGSYAVGGLTVEVAEGDITMADTDAIANAANDHLWMGSGVAGAIKRAVGDFARNRGRLTGVVLVLFGDDAFDAFDTAAQGTWGA